jgi:hypothetical protein
MPKPTNGDDTTGDDDAQITEETLRRDKEKLEQDGVDSSTDDDETDADDDQSDDDSESEGDDDGKTDDETQDDDSEDDSQDDSDDDDSDSFIKEFPNIKGDNVPDYARNLEQAYKNSTAEAIRLKKENDELKAKDTSIGDDSSDSSDDSGETGDKPKPITDPTQLYMKQKMDEEIVAAYTDFSKDYDQVDDPEQYNKFVATVGQLSKTILDSEKRVASPRELYSKSAVILGWQPNKKAPTKDEKAKIALKGRIGTSKGSSGPKKPGSKSKVTEEMLAVNRKMYPGKTDAQIREELEPHVQ